MTKKKIEEIVLHTTNGKSEFLTDLKRSLPNGIIHKKSTGIGATSNEIRDQSRNSIIVCPTRALAATKARDEKVFYWGSAYDGVKKSSIQEIQKAVQSGKIKVKVMVVADSLSAFLNKFGKDATSLFFLMFDEIDSFQSEVDYRPNLEETYLEYFRFSPDQRSMVSATIQEFSDPRLKSERRTEIRRENEEKLTLHCLYCPTHLLNIAASEILKMYDEDFKIMVALNDIDDITEVITLLPDQLKMKCGILCSESNAKVPKPLVRSLKNNQLPEKITFCTSAYFVGVDVKEKLNVVIVVDSDHLHKLISRAKLVQILGRARDGINRALLLFKTNPKTCSDPSIIRKELDKKKRIIMKIFNQLVKFKIESPQDKAMIDELIKRIPDFSITHGLPLFRETGKNQLKVNYLCLDNILQKHKTRSSLYVDLSSTQNDLSHDFNIILDDRSCNNGLPDTEVSKKSLKDLENQRIMRQTQILNDAWVDCSNMPEGEDKIIGLIWSLTKVQKSRLSGEKVKAALIQIINKPKARTVQLNKLYFQCRWFSEIDNRQAWEELNKRFRAGFKYTVDEIWNRFRELKEYEHTKALFSDRPLTSVQSVQYLKLLFKTHKPKVIGGETPTHKITATRQDEFQNTKKRVQRRAKGRVKAVDF